MADELTQQGFDDTIQKLSADIEAAGDGVERSVEDQSEVLERILARSVKAITTSLANSTRLVEQIAATQETIQDDEKEQDKQSIFLLTNLGMSLRGLLTLGVNAKLSDTERTREEKRTSDALIGALTDVGSGLNFIKNKLGDFLKLVSNPLALISAIVGIAIGAVAGFFAFFSRALNFPLLLQTLLKPLKAILDPKSRTGKAITGIAKALGRIIRSFVRVFGQFGRFILKSIPLVQRIINFIKPFIKFGRVLGGLLAKLALPLTIAISIVKAVLGFRDELKKGGDLIDATFRAIGDVLDFLTFGALNADQLKKFIGEPIRNFIAGIKELFTEGFSIATMRKIMEPLIQFMLATPNILIQAVGKITAFIADKLGFENFAEKLTAFLADFDLFSFINDSVRAVGDFFATIPARLAQLPDILGNIKDSIVLGVKAVFQKFIDDPLGTVKEIGETIVNMFTKITNSLFDFILSALPDFILPKELQEVKAARKIQKEQLKKVAAIQAELGLDTIKEATAELKRREKLEKLTASRGRTLGDIAGATDAESLAGFRLVLADKQAAIDLANQMAANANLRDKANRTAPAVLPIPAAPIIPQAGSSPSPIIAPLSMRNNENTFRRIMQKDFSGTQG